MGPAQRSQGPASPEAPPFLRRTVARLRRIPVLRYFARRLHPPVQAEVEGIRFVLHPGDNGTDVEMWRDNRLAEPDSVALVASVVSGKRVFFLDVGANSGVYALLVARLAAPGSRVVAVEANPVMAARLRRNIALNPGPVGIEVQEVALSDREGEAELNLCRGNFGQGSLEPSVVPGGHVRVQTRRVTSLIPEDVCNDELFAMKLDIEGHEATALRPLREADIALPHFLLIEISHADLWSHDLLQTLESRGYARTDHNAHGNIAYVRTG